MRITIEISDAELKKTSAKPQIIAEVAPQVAEEAKAPAGALPPPELLQAAARLGAESAGPAPTVLAEAVTDVTEFASLRAFGDMDEEGVDSEDAGSAPGIMPEAEPYDQDE